MSKVKIDDYLFQRLAQLNIKTVWGVPGDYELALLDLIGDAGIKFSGNANELVASYAADGYSRVNGAGAFVTTFGPGELSAYCGLAGAYAEVCPVVHVVGYPGVTAMKNHTPMHHSLATGEFDMYHEMVKHISVDTAVLVDAETAEGLKTPLKRNLPPNDKSTEEKVLKEIWTRVKKAKNPFIIMDGNTAAPTRDSRTSQASNGGGGSIESVRKAVEDDSDFVLWLGSFRTDFNTGELTDFVDEAKTIDMQPFFTKIVSQKYDAGIQGVLKGLLGKVEQDSSVKTKSKVDWDPYPLAEDAKGVTELKQDFLWVALSKLFQPGDMVVGDTGTSAFGLGATRYPKGCTGYNQTIFGSIGYADPSATGAFQAAKEAGKLNRGILVTGEGSLQLTPMCSADMLKLDIKPLVFVLNNNGYTVERLIHGKDAFYNELPHWDYKQLSTVFRPEHPSKYYGPIETCEELEKLLADPELHGGDCFQLVELVLGEVDAPWSVGKVTASIEAFNQKHAPKEAGTSMGG